MSYKQEDMEQGMEPEIKKFFLRIINTISLGLIWLIIIVAGGLYFKLGIPGARPLGATIVFYVLAIASFMLLLRYFYRLWKK